MTPASSSTKLDGSKVKGLNCPNCGGAMAVRGFEHTLTIVCPQCLSILDAKDPNLQILQKFTDKTRLTVFIPLGSRGNWRGTVYEAIGYQQRTINAGGEFYSWSEYLLFNPYKGFRYFTEYNGHWNDVVTLRALPQANFAMSVKPHVKYGADTFTHFSTAQAKTTYVLGEFPWQVRRGESVLAKDFIAPPKILSSEMTTSETTWSLGEYVNGAEIWQAFKLPGAPPKPSGVFANQPSPLVQKSKELWRLGRMFLLIAFALMLAGYVFSSNSQVFSDSYRYRAASQAEASFVTPVFDVKGRKTNVEVSTKTNLNNNWTYINYALINNDTGQAWDFGREVSYYNGRDSDGSWTEGSANDSVTIPNVPSGRYYLRVEPELAPGTSNLDFSIEVRRDVPRSSWFWFIALLLLIPPGFMLWRRFSFESRRWRESDYAPSGGSD